MIDEILSKLGLKYEDLDKPGYAGEKKQLQIWLEAISNNKVTTESIKTYIHEMRSAVEMELTKPGLDPKNDLFLKARLRNYLLLEGMLTSPERAKAQLEQNLASMVGGK